MKNSSFFLLCSQIWAVGSLNSDKHEGSMLVFCLVALMLGIVYAIAENKTKQKAPTEAGAETL